MANFTRLLVAFTAIVSILILSSCSPSSNAPTPTSPTVPNKTGDGTAPPEKKNRRIVFVFKVDGLLYGEACKKAAQQATQDFKGVSVEYRAPDKAENSKQVEIIEQLIADKVDAIVISANDGDAIVPVIKKAMDANIKVFTWDSDAAKSQRIFYVAAADDVQIGVEIADKLAADIGQKGKVQIVSGGRGAANLNLHIDGFKKGFAKYPGIKLIEPFIYNEDDNVKARSMATAAFQKDPDVAGFACANSPSPPAVGEAITQLNKIGKAKVWGLALPSETKQYLKSGAVSGLILWDPGKLTYLTAKLVNDFLDGKQPTDGEEIKDIGKISYKNGTILMGTTLINKDNVDSFSF